ncbi:hypothetical protein LINGRAHAP2_LOCUS34766 [Linum grandiflorum]
MYWPTVGLTSRIGPRFALIITFWSLMDMLSHVSTMFFTFGR